jgi:hypothetical protein
MMRERAVRQLVGRQARKVALERLRAYLNEDRVSRQQRGVEVVRAEHERILRRAELDDAAEEVYRASITRIGVQVANS